jgi:Holliday junction resolvase RusA-like endonuclease
MTSNVVYTTTIKEKALNKKNNMRAWGNRLVKSPKLEDYEKALQKHFKATAQAAPWIGPVKLSVVFTFGDKRRRDIQNCFDILCDAMNGIIYLDDSQIEVLEGSKKYSKDNWCIEIIVELL